MFYKGEAMVGNSFSNVSEIPCDENLNEKLSDSYLHWIALKEFVEKNRENLLLSGNTMVRKQDGWQNT